MHPLDSSSPSSTTDHFDMTGNFSEDDIQHLLGVMNATSHEVVATTANTANTEHSSQVGAVPNPVTQAAVDAAAAAACLPPTVESNMTTNATSNNEVDEEAKALARSERKRSREKQRRLDVNKQFTDLTTLIAKIEQEEREEDPTVFRQSFSATNRADLIARTVAHLERLCEVNKRRKTECATLQQQLQESQKAGEDMAAKYKEALCKNHGMGMMAPQNKPVMMMVPMMMPANAAQGMPQFGMQAAAAPMCNQFMMPQPAFMPQPAAAAAPSVPVAQQQQQQQQPLQHAPQHQHAQAPQQQQQQAPAPAPQQPQMAMPTMMTPQQMMFSSMQNVYPMVDPNATNAAMAATTPQQAQQMPMPMHFMAPPSTAAAPVVASTSTAPAEPKDDVQQPPSQQQQQHPSNNGQGNSSSAGGSNYAHCA